MQILDRGPASRAFVDEQMRDMGQDRVWGDASKDASLSCLGCRFSGHCPCSPGLDFPFQIAFFLALSKMSYGRWDSAAIYEVLQVGLGENLINLRGLVIINHV